MFGFQEQRSELAGFANQLYCMVLSEMQLSYTLGLTLAVMALPPLLFK